jgi:hypothetical protein
LGNPNLAHPTGKPDADINWRNGLDSSDAATAGTTIGGIFSLLGLAAYDGCQNPISPAPRGEKD